MVAITLALLSAQAKPLTKLELTSSIEGEIAITITPPRGWHTYWLNPGDSGMPPKITWKLPAGIKDPEIQWEAPQRIEADGLVSYGYEGPMRGLATFKIPASFKHQWKATATASVLVCKTECIAQSVTATMKFDRTKAASIQELRARLPKPATGNWTLLWNDGRPSLQTDHPTLIKELFPLQGTVLLHEQPIKDHRRAEGQTHYVLNASDLATGAPKEFSAVVRDSEGSTFWINPRILP